MSRDDVVRLYPPPGSARPLEGLYLAEDLRGEPGGAFVYANYVMSLDGRIAVPHPSLPGLIVPKSIANDRDWRLFQELAVQADVIFTSGRYLRDYADGRAQEILRVHDDARFADLVAWRESRGLAPQPDLAVISAGLDFPVPQALTEAGRRIRIITTGDSDRERRVSLSRLAEVIVAGKSTVEGRRMIAELADRGYRLMYNATGPKVLHMLLSDGQLHRLYLTSVPRLLGGEPYSSIVEGGLLTPPANFALRSLYLDTAAGAGEGQLFSAYDLAT